MRCVCVSGDIIYDAMKQFNTQYDMWGNSISDRMCVRTAQIIVIIII